MSSVADFTTRPFNILLYDGDLLNLALKLIDPPTQIKP
jgi:hypothetical protein